MVVLGGVEGGRLVTPRSPSARDRGHPEGGENEGQGQRKKQIRFGNDRQKGNSNGIGNSKGNGKAPVVGRGFGWFGRGWRVRPWRWRSVC